MNPVIGIDISSDKSTAIAYSNIDRIFTPVFEFYHNVSGFQELKAVLVKLEIETGVKPCVILEATGHYSVPVIKFISEEGYEVISINPLIVKQMKQNKLRKTKTDNIDCQNLVMIYYQKQYNNNYLKNKIERQLQSIHRDLLQYTYQS